MARPRTYDDQVRRRLLETASAAVASGGAAAVSVRAVAAEAGVTTAAVYSLFGSREALLSAVVEEGFRRFASHLSAVERTDDPAEDLISLGLAYRRNALQNPHFYRVMFGPGPESSAAYGEQTFGVLEEAIARVAQCDQDEARRRAERVWAYVHGLVSLELSGLRAAVSETSDAEADYLTALRAATSLVRTGPSR